MRVPIFSLSIILASVLLGVAVPKLVGQAGMRERMSHLGVSAGRIRVIGVLEAAAVAGLLLGLLWWPLGVAAAVGVALLLLGAVGFHLRARDPFPMVVVPLVFALAAAALAVLHVLDN